MIGVGDRVKTARLGTGRVESINGAFAMVWLDAVTVKISQPIGDLELLTPNTPRSVDPDGGGSGVSPIRASGQAPAKPGLSRERQSIEALRFGLVPYAHLEELTIGIDELADWVNSRLPHSNDGAPQVSEVCGPFGTGKSHMMAVVRHVARKNNYLTARVEIDGQNVTLSDPERLLYALWSTLEGGDLSSDTPLLDLYVAAMKKTKVPPLVAADGIDRIRDNFGVIRQIHEQNRLDVLGHVMDAVVSSSGEFTGAEAAALVRREILLDTSYGQVRRMIGQSVVDRPYDFIESIAGHAILARQAGFAGLAITIDEFELESATLTPVLQQRVAALIQVVKEYLDGRTGHRKSPVALFFASIGDADHEGDRVIEDLVRNQPDGCFVLEALDRDGRRGLAENIFGLYQRAYSIRAQHLPELTERVENDLDASEASDSGLTRAFIKRYVAALDARFGPSAIRPNVA